MARANIKFGFDSAPGVAGLKRVGKQAKDTSGKLAGMGDTARRLTGILAGLGVGVSLGALVRGVVSAASSFEDLQTRLHTVTGSADSAAAAFDRIKEFSATTPFQLEEVTSAFINLKAKGFDPTTKTLESIGNLASAFGKNITEATQAVTQAAFGEAESLKQFGIILRVEGDKARLTFKGVTKEISRDAQSIVDALLEIGRVDFAGATIRQSTTLSGLFSTLKDNVRILAAEFGNNLLPALKTSTAAMIDFAGSVLKNWNQLTAAVQNSLADIVDAAIAYTKLSDALVLFSNPLAEARSELELLSEGLRDKASEALDRAGRSVTELTESLAGSGGGGLTGAVVDNAAAVAAIKKYYKEWAEAIDQVEAAFESMAEAQEKAIPLSEGVSGGFGGGGESFLDLLDAEVTAFSADLGSNFEALVAGLGKELDKMQTAARWDEVGQYIGQVLYTYISQGIANGFNATQLGDLGQSLGGAIGYGIAGTAGQLIGEVIGRYAGEAFGKLLGSQNVSIGQVQFGGGGSTTATGIEGMVEIAQHIQELFRQLEELTGATIPILDQIAFNIMKEGEIWVNNLTTGASAVFDNLADALDFALSEALASADLSGVGDVFRQLIENAAGDINQAIANIQEYIALPREIGQLGGQLGSLRESIRDQIKAFETMRLRIIAMNLPTEEEARLLKNLERSMSQLNRELRSGALSSLAQWARDLGMATEVVVRAERLRIRVEFALIRAQLVLAGIWERWAGTWRELRRAALAAAGAVENTSRSLRGLSGTSGGSSGGGSSSGLGSLDAGGLSPSAQFHARYDSLIAEMNEFLRVPSAKVSSLARAFADLGTKFQKFLDYARYYDPGKVDDLMRALRRQVEALIQETLQPLRDFIQNARTGPLSPGRAMDRFGALSVQFFDTVAEALSGGIGGLEASTLLPGLAEELLRMRREIFGSSGYGSFFERIMDALGSVLNQDFLIDPEENPVPQAIEYQTSQLLDSLWRVRVEANQNTDRLIAAVNESGGRI